MARQRASQARAAFARVGAAPASPAADDDASPAAGAPAGENASVSASGNASTATAGNDGISASPRAGRKAGRPRRRVGRPRGPERIPLTVRILAVNDDRLTAAVRITGQSPQYIVDAALTAYFDALGVP